MAHTKELTNQIKMVAENLSKYMKIKVTECIGGIDSSENGRQASQSELLICTPGRLNEFIRRRVFDITKIKIFVLDEADELLGKNFVEQTKDIIKSLPKTCQICVFSATYPEYIKELIPKFTNEPMTIFIPAERLTLKKIKQYYINIDIGFIQKWLFKEIDKFSWTKVKNSESYRNLKSTQEIIKLIEQVDKLKLEIIEDLYKCINVGKCIIYVNSIERAEEVALQLSKENHTVKYIHGSMTSIERCEVMKEFRTGKFRILISTDLLARGIDVQDVSFVINYDIPTNIENYLHRIGRSGRYEKSGVSINFVSVIDSRYQTQIENHYKIKVDELPHFNMLGDLI